MMTVLAELPAAAFDKQDPSPDALFYAEPRFVTHIDATAIAGVTELYRTLLPTDGVVLDLMSSWVSHLPEDQDYAVVIGHGMNAEELAANPRLTRWFVQDLNVDPALPIDSASVGAVTMCVSVQYLQQPLAVLGEVRRILRPGGCVIIAFSNRCFPTKAVALWRGLRASDHVRLVSAYMSEAGFARVESRDVIADRGAGDPLHAVIGWTDA